MCVANTYGPLPSPVLRWPGPPLRPWTSPDPETLRAHPGLCKNGGCHCDSKGTEGGPRPGWGPLLWSGHHPRAWAGAGEAGLGCWRPGWADRPAAGHVHLHSTWTSWEWPGASKQFLFPAAHSRQAQGDKTSLNVVGKEQYGAAGGGPQEVCRGAGHRAGGDSGTCDLIR